MKRSERYPMPKWAVKQVRRESGLIEDVDKFGCGHPNIFWMRKHSELTKKYCLGIHGCNGQCAMREVDGFPGYLVDMAGGIYSIKNNLYMKTFVNKGGYVQTQLCINGNYKYVSVSRMVAIAFIENPDNKKEVNHIDGNKLNNSVENLEWSSPNENIAHSYRIGLRENNKKACRVLAKKCRKLSASDCKKIKKKWLNGGHTLSEIAKTYGVHKETIGRMLRRKTYN